METQSLVDCWDDIAYYELNYGEHIMSFLDKFLMNFDFKVSTGGTYHFAPYGDNAYYMECEFYERDGITCYGTVSVVFNAKTKKIFQYSTFDSKRLVEYVWYDPSVRDCALKENERQNKENPSEIVIADTDDEDDIFAKAHAIKNRLPYDADVVIDITIDSNTFMAACQAAHKMDITLNEFLKRVAVEEAERVNTEKSETE